MTYTPEQLRDFAERVGETTVIGHKVREIIRAHADTIEKCEQYRKALIHQRNALQIVRDRQHGNVSIYDLNKGIALIDAALKEPT